MCDWLCLKNSVVLQLLSPVYFFATLWTTACQGPLSSPVSWSLLIFLPLSQWCCLIISSSVAPFFCLQSFPAAGTFPLSRLFASGGQSIGASASALPKNIQGWFPLELTGLISLQSKGLSRVFSSATISEKKWKKMLYPLIKLNKFWNRHCK